MYSTPVPVLLAEADEIPLALRRSLLSNRFIFRNFGWNENSLMKSTGPIGRYWEKSGQGLFA